ncbi:hypothetical protein PENTCL1PPCAC_20838, partial [Pristionchus entomophagus]
TISSPRAYTHRELNDIAVDGGRLQARILITVARSYFALANVIDLNGLPIPPDSELLVERIFKGERPKECDW